MTTSPRTLSDRLRMPVMAHSNAEQTNAERREATDALDEAKWALESIIIRSREGDRNFNWLPTITNIANTALIKLKATKEIK